MREYKFHEVIALLTDDNNLQFESDSFIVKIKDKRLVFVDKFDGVELLEGIEIADLINTYTIYNESVSYIEALKAYAEGKRIKLQKVNNKTKELNNYVLTSDMNHFEFCIDDLKYGKWYILD